MLQLRVFADTILRHKNYVFPYNIVDSTNICSSTIVVGPTTFSYPPPCFNQLNCQINIGQYDTSGVPLGCPVTYDLRDLNTGSSTTLTSFTMTTVSDLVDITNPAPADNLIGSY